MDAGKLTYIPSAEHADDMDLALAELGTLILMNHSHASKCSHTPPENQPKHESSMAEGHRALTHIVNEEYSWQLNSDHHPFLQDAVGSNVLHFGITLHIHGCHT